MQSCSSPLWSAVTVDVCHLSAHTFYNVCCYRYGIYFIFNISPETLRLSAFGKWGIKKEVQIFMCWCLSGCCFDLSKREVFSR